MLRIVSHLVEIVPHLLDIVTHFVEIVHSIQRFVLLTHSHCLLVCRKIFLHQRHPTMM